MFEAGFVSHLSAVVIGFFVDHPGYVGVDFVVCFYLALSFFQDATPYDLTFFFAGGLATLVLRIVSGALFDNFLGALAYFLRR